MALTLGHCVHWFWGLLWGHPFGEPHTAKEPSGTKLCYANCVLFFPALCVTVETILTLHLRSHWVLPLRIMFYILEMLVYESHNFSLKEVFKLTKSNSFYRKGDEEPERWNCLRTHSCWMVKLELEFKSPNSSLMLIIGKYAAMGERWSIFKPLSLAIELVIWDRLLNAPVQCRTGASKVF